MENIKPINYAKEHHEIKPSLFRESENMDRLLQAIFDVCDEQQNKLLWLAENILNLDLATGYHLDFIGSIVGQPRFLTDFNTEPYFGYEGSYQSKTFGSSLDPEVGGYWNSRSHFNTATSRRLTDEEYRRLIKARVIFNQSNCTANELLEVINLITNSNNNTVQLIKHGLIQINTDDQTGTLPYFVDRLYNEDNILPIAAGVRVGLEQSASEGSGGGILDTDWIVEKVYEGSTGSKVGMDAVRTKNNLEVKSSIEVTPTVGQISDRIKFGEYGAEVNKAVLDIDPEASDWVLDPANNSIKYKSKVQTGIWSVGGGANRTSGNDPVSVFTEFLQKSGYSPTGVSCVNQGTYANCTSSVGGGTVQFTPDLNAEIPYVHIPISTVASKVIANAESGHVESKSLLLSVVNVLASMKFYDYLF